MNRCLVLLAAHNGAESVGLQLSTVLAQRGVDVVVDVSDDASSDATSSIVRDLARADARIRLLDDCSPKGSASANFFSLVRQADITGFDWVAFCDQDDEWHDFKLLRAVEMLQANSAAGYSSAVTAVWPDGQQRTLSQNALQTRADYLFEGAGQGCTFVIRAELFETLRSALNAQGEQLGRLHFHDWTTYAIARTFGQAWIFDERPTMRYVQHGGNDTGARTSSQGVKRRLAMIRNGWYRSQVRAIAAFVAAANPQDRVASNWLRLSDSPKSTSVMGRLRRAIFVARYGRRRKLDRMIQIAAVVLGYF